MTENKALIQEENLEVAGNENYWFNICELNKKKRFEKMVLGRGRMQNGFGLGLGGSCICPKCKTKAIHQRGVPCYQQNCPKCGSPMTREG